MKKIIAFVLAVIMVMSLGVTAFAEDCAVTFIELNDQIINVTHIEKGTPVGKPSDPVLYGYDFIEWRKGSADGVAWNFNDPVTENITLVAKWRRHSYTVTFDNQEHGTAPVEQSIKYKYTVTKPEDLTETGYTFGGWYKEAACENAWNFTIDKVTADTTLYAKWTPEKRNVIFDVKGHGTAPETQNVDYNKFATRPEDPSADGWHFDDWYADEELNSKFVFTTPITETTTLFAKWLKIHKVTFGMQNIGKESKPDPQYIIEGQKATRPDPDPSTEGYTFKGWYKEREGINEWKFDEYAITEDTTIYAKWEINKYTVSFDMNGLTDVTDVPTDITAVEHGNTVTRPETNPSKTGYVFVGWYQEAACETEFDFTAPITADTTVYAKWLKLITRPGKSTTVYTYTGSEQTYDIPAVDGEYTVSGNKGTAVGSYTATYALVDTDNTAWEAPHQPNGYKFTDIERDWEIVKATISPKFTENVTCTYGDDILAAAKAKVADEKSVVIASNDIVIKYKAAGDENFKTGVPTDAGTYTLAVNVNSSDNYDGYTADDKTCTLTINKKEVGVSWANSVFIYNGKDQKDDISAKFTDINNNNIDFDVAVTGGEFKNVGSYEVTASLKPAYEDNYTISSGATYHYSILAKDIADAEIELGDALVYNGKNQTQIVKKVKVGDLELTSADYDISGNVQKDVGTYTLTVTGKGNFTGTATKQFVVIPGKNYDYEENRYGDIVIGNGKIGFKDDNEKNMPEISIAGDKGDLVEMLVKMGKITPDDLVRIANGETLNVMLETQKAYVSDRVWDKIEKRAGSKEIDSYFDISFYLYWNNDTENRTDITDTSGYGYITIEVEAPDVKNAKSRSYSVIRYHNDGYRGHAVELSAKYSSKYDTLTFRTNQFSVYAIAYSKVNDKDDEEGKIVINGKGDKKKEDKKDINPNTGAFVFE